MKSLGFGEKIDLGPIPLEILESRIIAGDVETVKALSSEDLEKVMKRTKQQAVAMIILDLGDEVLLEKLMNKYKQGHFGDEKLKKLREDGMRDLIKQLKKVTKL
ncbi:hypothetical protein HQ571_00775 [Candidatus Kuenenbacteria bacterium]|nr:hypothetical protein [Candidatus Kuenenbacteria bacterium]